MNTSKQVNVMIGLMFVFLIGTLLYFVWDTVRAEDAQERQIVVNAERGGKLFSLNCRSCHGINGLGPLENPNAVSELGWEAAVEEANLGPPHGALLPGKKLAEAASASATTLVFTDAQKLTIGSLLRVDEEVLKIVHAPVNSTLLKAVDSDQT